MQDWGGTLGLTLPVDPGCAARLERLIVMNTSLPVGEPLGRHFYEWRATVRSMPDPPVGKLMHDSAPQLSDAEVAAYDAPFPDARFKAGVRAFPELAMVEPDMDGVADARAALKFWAEEWTGKSFMAIGLKDPDHEAMYNLKPWIRDCPEPTVLPEGGHFLPEEAASIARAALRTFGEV